MKEETPEEEIEGIDLEADEHQYYPDALELDENVIISYRPKGLKSLLNFKTYYVTDKRIFSEHNITKKRDEVDFQKVNDVLIIQKGLEEKQNTGTIIVEHSNYKNDVPITKKKQFIMPGVNDPKGTYIKIKQELDRHKK